MANTMGSGIRILMVAEELGQFLRGKLFPPRIEKNQPAPRALSISPAQFQERSFIFEGDAFCFGVLPQAFQIFFVSDWMAGFFVLPIHAMVSFTGTS